MNLGAIYIKNSAEALAFYLDAFGMELGYNAKNGDGTYLHAELMKDGQSIFAVSENTDEELVQAMLKSERPTMSYGLNLGSNAELEHAFEVLSQGGHVLRELGPLPWTPLSADLVDRYGVCWYLFVSQHRPDEETTLSDF